MANTRRSIRTVKPLVAVLAAGRATRFGGGKLEAMCAGKPLGRWALDAAEGLGAGIVVTGPEGLSFAGEWQELANPMPEAGLGTSLALAARAAIERDAPALLVLLADMPLVTSEYLRELANATAPAATRYPDGHPGVPALLDRALIEQAANLTGHKGAAPLLKGAQLHIPAPDMLFDVDTPADLAEAGRQLLAR